MHEALRYLPYSLIGIAETI